MVHTDDSFDLTKRLYLLVSKAKGLSKGNTNISYVYSVILIVPLCYGLKIIILSTLIVRKNSTIY